MSEQYYENQSFRKAVEEWKEDNHIVWCRGAFIEGALHLCGVDTMGRERIWRLKEGEE